MENPNRNNRSFDQTAMLTFNYFNSPSQSFPLPTIFPRKFLTLQVILRVPKLTTAHLRASRALNNTPRKNDYPAIDRERVERGWPRRTSVPSGPRAKGKKIGRKGG